jgi:hypothetical protein
MSRHSAPPEAFDAHGQRRILAPRAGCSLLLLRCLGLSLPVRAFVKVEVGIAIARGFGREGFLFGWLV